MSETAQTDTPTRSDHHRVGFLGSVKVVAGLTLLSRVLGMVRDIAIVSLGATVRTDIFWTAFTIPNLFRRLFGEGALTAAFVPVFTESDQTDRDAGRAVLSNVLGLLATVLCGLWVIGSVIAAGWIALHRPDVESVLLCQLVLLVLPFMVMVCLLALGSAALNCRKHFAYPAFAPVLLNIFLIAAAGVLHLLKLGDSWQGLFLLASAVSVAGVVQLLGLMAMLRRHHLLVRPRIRPLLPATKRIAAMTLPMLVPLGALQFSALFERVYALVMSGDGSYTVMGYTFARPLAEGVVTRLYAANRLFQFPLGLLSISVATVVFPLLSRHAADNDMPGLRTTTNMALRLNLFMGIPAAVALMLLARPIVSVLFEHDAFTAADAAHTAFILQMYCIGLWAVFCNHILLRALFALKDTKHPLQIAATLVILNMLIVVGIVFTPLREAGIGLAATFTAILNTLALGFVLRRRIGSFGMTSVFASMGKTVIATGVMVGAIVGLHYAMTHAGVSGDRHDLLMLAGGVPAGLAAFVLAAGVLRSNELKLLVGSFRRKRTDAPEGNRND
jgi:putative peptidoglycan lipid II flippase